ncbi:hypothetical protein VIBNISOn1_480037 [Vibrio nigripulchritudo SOn1]|uniref:Uncharacterized protein n=1 Tax=Vibrio nigripulchritudo SOn1 TaxID=1238450 RepID=A0AAV2VUT7_9VIBR|nr:hypothetical protein VIBNISOn1_480037 [Vibrio nigripulchritudo SOn1]
MIVERKNRAENKASQHSPDIFFIASKPKCDKEKNEKLKKSS